MSLIYFGTGTFALPALRVLAGSVVLVVTQPDRPSGRGMRLHPSPVKSLALELGLRVESPEKSRAPEFVQMLEDLQADALVVASYGQILSQRVLDSAKYGGINLHGSILPKYRGAAPIQRAVLNGETETGISLMQMDKGMDTGDIIEIERTPIGPDETYGELQDRLAEVAAGMTVRWMPRIVRGDYERLSQVNEDATIAPKIEKPEAELQISRRAKDEYNRYRAFTPSPGAFMTTQSGLLKVSRAALSNRSGEPGTVLSSNPLLVAFEEGSFELREIQPEGKKRMAGADFANGARLRPGSRLV